jgi:hypothetical protein
MRLHSRASLLALVTLALLLSGNSSGEDSPAPLRNEDVVRMLVAGKSTSSIVKLIETSPAVDFDVSPDMITELQSASVPKQVLDAMKARMAEIDRAKAVEERVQALTSGPKLRIHFAGTTKLLLADWGTQALGEKLQLDLRGSKDREIRDVAYFVACTTEEHLPEQWRSKSPLGRDYTIPKHQMLLFQPGGAHLSAHDVPSDLPDAFHRTRDDGTPSGYFELTLPPDAAVEVATDEPHDLLVGIAIDIQGVWHPLVIGKEKKVEIGATGTDLTATLSGKPELFELTLKLGTSP